MIPSEGIEPEFISEKCDIVMIKSVRVAAQLGNLPQKFFTNVSELTNNVLKLKVERKPQSLPAFVNHVQKLDSAQVKNI